MEDDVTVARATTLLLISIHVLRVEDDTGQAWADGSTGRFQSTSSVWRTTWILSSVKECFDISIHVLRVEDDPLSSSFANRIIYFNPRPPCGGRPDHRTKKDLTAQFQSTSSVWRTTAFLFSVGRKVLISIHVLRVEDDIVPLM